MPFVFFGDEEKKAAWGTLPQAHTCSNTLELPNYCEAWQWRRQYEMDGATERQRQGKPGEEEPPSLASQTEGTEGSEEPSVEELAGLIRERLLTAACGSQGFALDEL